jgi:hypothetical protein
VIGKRRIFTTEARRHGEGQERLPGLRTWETKTLPLINADDTDHAGQIKWRLLKFQIGTRLAYLGHCTKKTFSGLLPDL